MTTRNSEAATRRTEVLRLARGAAPERVGDEVAVEEPIELRIGGKPATVIMRTPGHDEELALGFLYGEGLVRAAEDVAAIARPAALKPEEIGNVLDVTMAPRLVGLRPRTVERSFYASSSCGVCGKSSLQAIEVHAARVTSTLTVPRRVVAGLPERMAVEQAAFARTGGLHAAGLFDERGELVALREDVGRHNAVDKLVGWAFVGGRLPAARSILLVSGRTSFEILQKAAMAGVPVVCAVSAPSSLAVSLAERMGITLVGFLRAGSMNVYAHAERIGE